MKYWNATFRSVKPFFIAGTPRSKASNPFLLPERHVPRHQTLFYCRNATFQGIKPFFIAGTPRSKASKPFFIAGTPRSKASNHFFIAGTPRSGILNHKMNCIFRGKTRAQLGSTLFFSTFGSAKLITISFSQNFIISSIIIYLLNFLI